MDPPEHRQAGSHPGQRVHRGRSGHEWFDLNDPAMEGLPSAAVKGWDRPGAGDAVAGEVAADGLEDGYSLAGHKRPVDPGHVQRPVVGDQQVQIDRTAQVRGCGRGPHAPVRPQEPFELRRGDGPGATLARRRVIHGLKLASGAQRSRARAMV